MRYWRVAFILMASFNLCFLIFIVILHFSSKLCFHDEIPKKFPMHQDTQSRHHRHAMNNQISRPELQKKGWTVDCVTWSHKWEVSPLESDPHEFVDDDNFKHTQNLHSRIKAVPPLEWGKTDLQSNQHILAVLHNSISKLKTYLGVSILSIADVGCGTLQWMQYLIISRDDIQYTCYELQKSTVAKLQNRHSSLDHTYFTDVDIVATAMNQSFDLVLLRDVLDLLYPSDALYSLLHISSSGSQFLLVTNFPDTTTNPSHDSVNNPGSSINPHFSYNLELPPFLFTPPICSSYDKETQHIAMWELPLRQKYEY